MHEEPAVAPAALRQPREQVLGFRAVRRPAPRPARVATQIVFSSARQARVRGLPEFLRNDAEVGPVLPNPFAGFPRLLMFPAPGVALPRLVPDDLAPID